MGRVEDQLRGAVVLFQLDDGGVGVVGLEVEDVAQVRSAPAVDRLVVIADHRQVAVLLGEELDPQVLGTVGVLVLIDVQVAPALLVAREHRRRLPEEAHGLQQQVIEVEGVGGLETSVVARIGGGVAALEIATCLLVRLGRADHVVLPAADGREHGRGSQLAGTLQLQITQHLLDDAGLVVGVVDGEARVDADGGAVATQHARAECVEGAHGHAAALRTDQGEDALAHLGGGLVGEGHRQDLPRLHALHPHEVGDAMGQDTRLARAGAGEDQKWSLGGRDRAGLLGVEPLDDVCRERARILGSTRLDPGVRGHPGRGRFAGGRGDHGEPLGVVSRGGCGCAAAGCVLVDLDIDDGRGI